MALPDLPEPESDYIRPFTITDVKVIYTMVRNDARSVRGLRWYEANRLPHPDNITWITGVKNDVGPLSLAWVIQSGGAIGVMKNRGRATFGVHPKFLEQAPYEELVFAVLHETAHLAGRYGHGKKWKGTFRRLLRGFDLEATYLAKYRDICSYIDTSAWPIF